MALKIIIGWLLFCLFVYAFMWVEQAYYSQDLPTKFRRIMDSFTEEE